MKPSPIKKSYTGLVDCNNFFVSCERLFRPDLQKKPVLVLSSNDGCVISRSNEVKALGIPMGIPHFEIKDSIKKNEITVFSSNFALYRDISARVMETLASLVDDIEVYSIDEAFFTVEVEHAHTVGTAIRQRIGSWIGIPVSVGIAETKTLAKYAGSIAKKNEGVSILNRKDVSQLYAVQLIELWGVGRKTSERLSALSITTVGDVLSHGSTRMHTYLGVVGERLYFELAGIPSIMNPSDDVQQSIMSTRSFGKKTSLYKVVADAVSYHLTHTAEKLRKRDWVATGAYMQLRYTDTEERVRYVSYKVEFESPTSSTPLMARALLLTLKFYFNPRYTYEKAGVVLFGISKTTDATMSLFNSESGKEMISIMKVFDSINKKYGSDTMRIGTLGHNHEWRSKTAFLSQSYTTSWTELPIVQG